MDVDGKMKGTIILKWDSEFEGVGVGGTKNIKEFNLGYLKIIWMRSDIEELLNQVKDDREKMQEILEKTEKNIKKQHGWKEEG